MSLELRPRERSGEHTCPLCWVELAPDVDPVANCEGCAVGYHVDCLHELGGCATLGCSRLGWSPEGLRPQRSARFSAKDREHRREILAREHADRLARERADFESLQRRLLPRTVREAVLTLLSGLFLVLGTAAVAGTVVAGVSGRLEWAAICGCVIAIAFWASRQLDPS